MPKSTRIALLLAAAGWGLSLADCAAAAPEPFAQPPEPDLTQPRAAATRPNPSQERRPALSAEPLAPLAQASAASASGVTPPADNPVTLSIRLPRASTSVQARQEGRELLISLDGPLPALDLPALQSAARGQIESLQTGFDALLLVLRAGVSGTVETDGDELRIRLKGGAVSQTLGPHSASESRQGELARQPDKEGSFRLGLLRAQVAERTGDRREARSRYLALRAEAPGRPEPVLALANLDREAGFARRSLASYAEAASLGAPDTTIRDGVTAVQRSRASHARVEAERREQRSGDLAGRVILNQLRASWQQRLSPAWQFGGSGEVTKVETQGVLRRSGDVEAFAGRRERANLSGQFEAMGGSRTVASLFLQAHRPGVGLEQRFLDDAGQTTLTAEFRRANWDYVENVVEQATRNRLAVGRLQRFAPNLMGRIELGVNDYAFPAFGSVARTTKLAGDLRLLHVAGAPGLMAVYAVDGEYVNARHTYRAASGKVFEPLPLLNREVHTLTLGYVRALAAVALDTSTTFDLYAGYGKDRYGLSGPLAGAAVTFVRGPVELQLRASHVRNIGNARSTTSSAGAFLVVRFW